MSIIDTCSRSIPHGRIHLRGETLTAAACGAVRTGGRRFVPMRAEPETVNCQDCRAMLGLYRQPWSTRIAIVFANWRPAP